MAITPTAAQLSVLMLNEALLGTACGTTVMAAALPTYTDGNTYAQSLISANSALSILSTDQLYTKVITQMAAGTAITSTDISALVSALDAYTGAGQLLPNVGAGINLLATFLYNNASTLNNVWSTTAQTLVNKTNVASFYTLDQGNAAASTSILSTVTSDPATATAIISGSTVVGQTFSLTTGVDTLVGTSGNDTFNASNTSASTVLGGLDSIDGGAGNDVLNVADTATAATADFAFPAGFTVKNVETLNVTTNGAIGTKAGTAFDISGLTGLTSATLIAAGAGTASGSNVKAAGTTDVSLTVSGNNQVDIAGGKAVSVVSGATGTGTTGVTGAALTTVSVKGGGVATIDNTSAAGTTSVGTTMTAVTLDGVAGATAAVKGAAVTTLNLQNQKTALAVTVTNDTSTALTVNTNGVGYDATGAAVADSVAAGSKAATINVNATGTKSNLTITAAAGKTLNITGDAALTLAPIASVTKLDGSAATGNLSLGTLNAVTVDVKTGSGADTFTATTTNKLAVDAGAGNDNVTLSGALVAGSSIALGAGNDHLIATSAALTSATATSVIDGGDGTDTVSAQMINAGNASLFKNFEGLSLNSTTGLDIALLTGNTIGALYIDSATTAATYQNVTQSMATTASYVENGGGGTGTAAVGNGGTLNTLSMTGATGTSDSYTITFAGDNSASTTTLSAANVGAKLAIAGIENVSVVSGGTKTWNMVNLADANAKTLTITGAQNLDVAFAAGFGTAGTSGLSSIDGSAATGKLAIDLTNTGISSTAGLTVKGGSAADTITTTTTASTLTGGAGADTFNVAATVTGSTSAPVFTTITDASAGDIISTLQKGAETWVSTKVDVSTATALFGGTVNALDLASTGDGSTNAIHSWFQYGGNTYIVEDTGAAATFTTGDVVVKLNGLIDLSTAVFTQNGGTASTLTLA